MSTVTFDVKSNRSRASSRRSKSSKRSAFTRSSRSTRKTRRSRRGRRGLRQSDFRAAGLVAPKSTPFSSSSKMSRRIQGGGQTRTPIPAQMTFCTARNEETFSSRHVKHPEHGPGITTSFSARAAVVGSNGVVLNGDYTMPFETSTINDPLSICGFLTADTKYCSGFFLHPRTMGGRLATESKLWGRWRYRWIRVTYNTYVGTNNNGILHFALSRNPTLLIEGVGASSTTVNPSSTAVTECIPGMSVTRFGTGSIHIGAFEKNLYKTDIYTLTNQAPTNNFDYIGYLAERHCLRLVALSGGGPAAGAVSPWGDILVEGEIEFYNPVPVGVVSVGFVFGSVVPAFPPIPGEDEMKSPNTTALHKGEWKCPQHLLGSRPKLTSIKIGVASTVGRPIISRFEQKYESKYPVPKRPASVTEEPDYDTVALSPPPS